MVSNPCGRHLILGSCSPRRRELLGMICSDFSIAPPIEVDESYPADMHAEQVPVYLSQLKARAYMSMVGDSVLITADTVVIHNDTILGKPHNAAEAAHMLRRLSGSTHRVATGVTLTDRNHSHSFATVTDVHFDHLSDEEISAYIRDCHPLDKAGAYGIQEWIGAIGISGIDGCYYNVMGLPLHDLYEALRSF